MYKRNDILAWDDVSPRDDVAGKNDLPVHAGYDFGMTHCNVGTMSGL
jgi:hypothetical protein